MKHGIALVKNIQRLLDAYAVVERADSSAERMVLLSGATGTGKTTAAIHLMNQTGALYVQATPAWTLTSMYRAIATAIGVEPKGRAADLESLIVAEMGKKGRALIIDEVDHLLLPGAATTLRMLEALRSLHDQAGMPVIMIGMDQIERKLRAREQLFRRIFQLVRFTDLDRPDVRTVAETLCPIPIADAWLDALHVATKGRISYVSNNIERAAYRAKSSRWSEITLDLWGGPLFTVGK